MSQLPFFLDSEHFLHCMRLETVNILSDIIIGLNGQYLDCAFLVLLTTGKQQLFLCHIHIHCRTAICCIIVYLTEKIAQLRLRLNL